MKKCECGNMTNDTKGICAICRLKGVTRTTTTEPREGTEMKTKVCKTCEKEFEPTSNRQMYCTECKVQKSGEVKPPKPPKAAPSKPEVCLSGSLVVDLSDYPEINAWLQASAKAAFREPHNQVMAILHEAFQASEGK